MTPQIQTKPQFFFNNLKSPIFKTKDKLQIVPLKFGVIVFYILKF